MRKNFDGAEVDVMLGTGTEIVSWIIAGNADIGFLRWPFSRNDELDIITLRSEEWIVVCSPNHRLASREGRLSHAEIAKYPLIMPSRESLYLPLLKELTINGKSPHINCFYFELENGAALAQSGVGVAIMPACTPEVTTIHGYVCKKISNFKERTMLSAIRKSGIHTETEEKIWKLLQKYENKM